MLHVALPSKRSLQRRSVVRFPCCGVTNSAACVPNVKILWSFILDRGVLISRSHHNVFAKPLAALWALVARC